MSWQYGGSFKENSGFDTQKVPGIPFKQMSQMREIVVHDYDGINYMIIWDTVTKEIPPLEEKMESLLRAIENEEQDGNS